MPRIKKSDLKPLSEEQVIREIKRQHYFHQKKGEPDWKAIVFDIVGDMLDMGED
jgi:hypothetical protein